VDLQKFRETALRHRNINNPLSHDTLLRIIDLCNPPGGSRTVDVGCGKGDFLLQLAKRRAVLGEGFDLSDRMIGLARARARQEGLSERLSFRCADARSLGPPQEPYFLSVCLGATQAFGGLRRTLSALRAWTEPNGWIVVGEGYWKRRPSTEYLEVLGADPDELLDDQGNAEVGEGLGLSLAERWSSTSEEWDGFEDAYAEGIESYAWERPDDPDVPEMLHRIRRWRDGYLRWGKQTLGFGVYVFRPCREPNPVASGVGWN
jgi:SAM-dependent methyltransferase